MPTNSVDVQSFVEQHLGCPVRTTRGPGSIESSFRTTTGELLVRVILDRAESPVNFRMDQVCVLCDHRRGDTLTTRILDPSQPVSKYYFLRYVGVELEGGWDSPPRNLGRDGSVIGVEGTPGEMASPKLYPFDWRSWVQSYYPTSVNDTCGLHVHVSFYNKVSYARIMDFEFYQFFLWYMTAWGERQKVPKSDAFWTRLAGHNHYCSRVHRPMQQVTDRGKGGRRYTQLNYCWSLHGTVECRLLPGFRDIQRGLAGIEAVLNSYELYLRGCKGQEPTIEAEIEPPSVEGIPTELHNASWDVGGPESRSSTHHLGGPDRIWREAPFAFHEDRHQQVPITVLPPVNHVAALVPEVRHHQVEIAGEASYTQGEVGSLDGEKHDEHTLLPADEPEEQHHRAIDLGAPVVETHAVEI